MCCITVFTGCETPVSVDLDTAAPKLVVDASINWEKGTAGNEQKIKLTTTTGYFSYVIPTISGATVTVANSLGTVFVFTETPGTGEYVCSGFIPEIGETYTLTILYNGQTLTATETMRSVPAIDKIEQETSPGIGSEENRIDIKTFFTDPGNTTDFYMSRTQSSIQAIPEYSVTSDEFFQGNQVFDLYLNEDTKPGNVIEVRLYGISEQYFNYMTILTGIAGGGGGPFSTPSAALRGNIVNTTQPDNFILGYFSISEVDRAIYVVN